VGPRGHLARVPFPYGRFESNLSKRIHMVSFQRLQSHNIPFQRHDRWIQLCTLNNDLIIIYAVSPDKNWITLNLGSNDRTVGSVDIHVNFGANPKLRQIYTWLYGKAHARHELTRVVCFQVVDVGS